MGMLLILVCFLKLKKQTSSIKYWLGDFNVSLWLLLIDWFFLNFFICFALFLITHPVWSLICHKAFALNTAFQFDKLTAPCEPLSLLLLQLGLAVFCSWTFVLIWYCIFIYVSEIQSERQRFVCVCVCVHRWANCQKTRRRSWRGRRRGSSGCWMKGCMTCRRWRSWKASPQRTVVETHGCSGSSAKTGTSPTRMHRVRTHTLLSFESAHILLARYFVAGRYSDGRKRKVFNIFQRVS